jgi:hypothetical protein
MEASRIAMTRNSRRGAALTSKLVISNLPAAAGGISEVRNLSF